jgi:hypothetical protein
MHEGSVEARTGHAKDPAASGRGPCFGLAQNLYFGYFERSVQYSPNSRGMLAGVFPEGGFNVGLVKFGILKIYANFAESYLRIKPNLK